MQQGRKPHYCCREIHSLPSEGALTSIIFFTYFAKCVTSEINRHHQMALKLDLICVLSALDIFGGVQV